MDSTLQIPVDNRATYLECGLMSRAQYLYKLKPEPGFLKSMFRKNDSGAVNTKIPPNVINDGELHQRGWVVDSVHRDEKYMFLATIYSNQERKQVVVAYRGTDSFTALLQGYKEIWNSKVSGQKLNAFFLIKEAIAVGEKFDKENSRVTFTGHSLGGFLAIVSTFFATDLSYKDSNSIYRNYHFNAVAFESPGQLESMEELQPTQEEFQIELNGLDIMSFLSYPNAINTLNSHIGTIMMMDVRIPKKDPGEIDYLKKCHSSEAILEFLRSWESTDPFLSASFKPVFVRSWPKWRTTQYFFETHQQSLEGKFVLKSEDETALFRLRYKNRFQTVETEINTRHMLPIRNFDKNVQEFLRRSITLRVKNIPENIKCYKLESFGDNIQRTQFVVLTGGGTKVDIFKFRTDISKWLSESGGVDKVLDSIAQEVEIPKANVPGNVTFIRAGKNLKISKTEMNGITVCESLTTIDGGARANPKVSSAKISFIDAFGDVEIEEGSTMKDITLGGHIVQNSKKRHED